MNLLVHNVVDAVFSIFYLYNEHKTLKYPIFSFLPVWWVPLCAFSIILYSPFLFRLQLRALGSAVSSLSIVWPEPPVIKAFWYILA